MKKIIGFFLFLCLLLGGCAKNNQTVWRVSTLGSGEEINLPVAKNVGFCAAMLEKKVDKNALMQRSITVDGETYVCPYIETKYVPALNGPEMLKQRRTVDFYRSGEVDIGYFSGTDILSRFYNFTNTVKDGDCTEETVEDYARNYLKLFYSDADDYSLDNIEREVDPRGTLYRALFIRKIHGISSTDGIIIRLNLAGELYSLKAMDYQIFNGVNLSTEQVNEAKARLDAAIAENNLVPEGEVYVVMGDDGELYLSVQASYYEAHNEEVGVTILEELFTRL